VFVHGYEGTEVVGGQLGVHDRVGRLVAFENLVWQEAIDLLLRGSCT